MWQSIMCSAECVLSRQLPSRCSYDIQSGYNWTFCTFFQCNIHSLLLATCSFCGGGLSHTWKGLTKYPTSCLSLQENNSIYKLHVHEIVRIISALTAAKIDFFCHTGAIKQYVNTSRLVGCLFTCSNISIRIMWSCLSDQFTNECNMYPLSSVLVFIKSWKKQHPSF